MMENVSRADGAALGIGTALGVVGSAIAHFRAQAAVTVRPRLADVGFIDAALTNHGTDWLYYHYPLTAATVSVVFFGAAVFGARRWLYT